MSANKHEKGADFVVAIDFGTTFSGHAFVRKSGKHSISRFFEWPGANAYAGRHYCKTMTALFYVGDQNGNYQLDSWGWPALDKYTDAMRLAKRAGIEIWSTSCGVTTFQLANPALLRKGASGRMAASNGPSSSTTPFSCPGGAAPGSTQPDVDSRGESFGCFITEFKLDLIRPSAQRLHLPGNLHTERLIIDYLRSMTDFIMEKLRDSYDNRLKRENVEWCLTVPSIWDVQAKQKMIACAEQAGLANIKQRGEHTRSIAPVGIILEPEGASVYCQMEVSKSEMLRKGDRLMIADVGGGTIDMVVHAKAEDDVESTKVDEEVSSYGELGGGAYVDAGFFALMAEKIGPASFQEICWQEPGTRLKLSEWWQSAKKGFNSSGHYSVPLDLRAMSNRLYEAWKEQQRLDLLSSASDDEELWLEDSDFRNIFDPEVTKVINLINMQITRGVKVLMVVGGFSTSPYLQHQVKERFKGEVGQILFPDEPGSAISYGAVQLHLHNSIRSRIAPRTYGIEHIRKKEAGDPPDIVYKDIATGSEMCRKVLHTFVRKGQKVPCGYVVTHVCKPGHQNQRRMRLELYSSDEARPTYTTTCRHEGGFEFDIMQVEPKHKKRNYEVEVQMVFGASSIEVTAVLKSSFSKIVTPAAATTTNVATFIAPLDNT